MSTQQQLELLLLSLSLLTALPLEVGALPAPHPSRETRPLSSRPIVRPDWLEANAESLHEPSDGKKDGLESAYSNVLPGGRAPHHNHNRNRASVKRLLQEIRAIDMARMRAGLEEILEGDHQRLPNDRESLTGDRRLKRANQRKARRRAPYDFIVL